jgi:hypothetical protein
MAGSPGTEVAPGRPPGAAGATGASGGCTTVFGVEGLNVGLGGGTGGVTGCARVWPGTEASAKAKTIAASEAAPNAAERPNRIAAISGLLRAERPCPLKEIRESGD